MHKIASHRTYKPCRNLPNCQFKDQCLFNHNQIKDNEFICFQCGKIFTSISDLMNHRKATHKKNMCIRFKNKICDFTNDKCWFSHETEESATKENEQKITKSTGF